MTPGVVGIAAGTEKQFKTSKLIILPCNYFFYLGSTPTSQYFL
jgi:hypothetical protein